MLNTSAAFSCPSSSATRITDCPDANSHEAWVAERRAQDDADDRELIRNYPTREAELVAAEADPRASFERAVSTTR